MWWWVMSCTFYEFCSFRSVTLYVKVKLYIYYSFLKHLLTDIGNSWTAGQRVNVTNDPSSFIWILQTSNYYAKLPINYDGWILREPNNNGGHEYCLVQVQYVNYFWQDRSCADRNVFFCEIDIAWSGARQHTNTQTRGCHIAELNTKTINQSINHLFENTGSNNNIT